MTLAYPIPAAESRAVIEVSRSRFIAVVAPAFTVEQARAFIQRIKAEFPDANHHVSAFVIGHGASVTAHCHDDGEPSGTAGQPVLAVLKGSGLGDAVVVVTRYFGGVKLGTGGLVRAYGEAARAGLDQTARAQRVPTHTVMLALPYSHLERVRLLLTEHGGTMLDEVFAGDILLTVRLSRARFPAFQAALQEMTHGTLTAEIVETCLDTIMPWPTI